MDVKYYKIRDFTTQVNLSLGFQKNELTQVIGLMVGAVDENIELIAMRFAREIFLGDCIVFLKPFIWLNLCEIARQGLVQVGPFCF